PLRGNLDTRLARLDGDEYDAIILASVGLRRLELAQRIRSVIDVADSLPSAGQGALGIEIRDDRDDLAAWLAPLIDSASAACALAERAVSRDLGGSCQVPLAAYAHVDEATQTLWLRALVAKPDGSHILRAERSGDVGHAEELGRAVAAELKQAGADALLSALLKGQ